MLFQKWLHDFVLLFTVIDPIGSVPLFLSLTTRYSIQEQRHVARRAIIYSFIILVGFLLLGKLLLNTMGIRLGSFQIAGGLILFLFGLQMIFKPETEESEGHKEAGRDIAVFPMAIPSLASPGAITAIIVLTDNAQHNLFDHLTISGLLMAVLIIAYFMLRMARKLHAILGENGTAILVRVMGLILSALAVETVVEGISNVFGAVLKPLVI